MPSRSGMLEHVQLCSVSRLCVGRTLRQATFDGRPGIGERHHTRTHGGMLGHGDILRAILPSDELVWGGSNGTVRCEFLSMTPEEEVRDLEC